MQRGSRAAAALRIRCASDPLQRHPDRLHSHDQHGRHAVDRREHRCEPALAQVDQGRRETLCDEDRELLGGLRTFHRKNGVLGVDRPLATDPLRERQLSKMPSYSRRSSRRSGEKSKAEAPALRRSWFSMSLRRTSTAARPCAVAADSRGVLPPSAGSGSSSHPS